jgi:hypothetical protein
MLEFRHSIFNSRTQRVLDAKNCEEDKVLGFNLKDLIVLFGYVLRAIQIAVSNANGSQSHPGHLSYSLADPRFMLAIKRGWGGILEIVEFDQSLHDDL